MTEPIRVPTIHLAGYAFSAGECFVRTDPTAGGRTQIVLRAGGQEHVLVEGQHDQWGVWITIGDQCVAQEDETSSFVDALIKCLHAFRHNTEADTTDATLLTDDHASNEKRTRRGWLETIDCPKTRDAAPRHMAGDFGEPGPRDLVSSLHQALSGAFAWSATPEGHDFWDGVASGRNPPYPERTAV